MPPCASGLRTSQVKEVKGGERREEKKKGGKEKASGGKVGVSLGEFVGVACPVSPQLSVASCRSVNVCAGAGSVVKW